MVRDQEQYKIYDSCRRALVLLFSCSLFVAAPFLLSLKKTPPWYIWLFAAFFGLGLLSGLYRLLNRRPRLVLDGHGIHDRRMRGQSFPWEAIRDVSLASLAGQSFLSLELDANHPDVRSPSAKAMKLNSFFGMEAFNISVSELRVDPHRLCTAVLIMSRIPLEERKALLRKLVDSDGLLPGERPEPDWN